MRRPLRKPHGISTSDIENFETESKYIIYLDGTNYVAINGDTGAEDSRNISAHTVIQYAIDNGGAGVVSVKCDVALTAVVTGVAQVILDGNNHTITPATSFDMIHMMPDFTVRNCIFDVSGVVWAHACFVIDGIDDYWGTGTWRIFRTNIIGCSGYSTTSQGIFVSCICDGANETICNVHVDKCITRRFEYAYKLVASAGTSWINGNKFTNLFGLDDKYFIYIDEGATNAIDSNQFTFNSQTLAATDTHLTIDGRQNYFKGMLWDVGAGETAIHLLATALQNFIILPVVDLARVTDDSTGENTIYDWHNPGFIGKTDFNFFEQTTLNPYVRIYGDVTGTEKYGFLQMSSTGVFTIKHGTGTSILLGDGPLELAYDGNGDISCFTACDTDENRHLKIHGRNNADDARGRMELHWGDGTHEDGEISTNLGDLRLNPAGVLRFGTRTATGDAVSNGYVTIKDSAGNSVKLMTTA